MNDERGYITTPSNMFYMTDVEGISWDVDKAKAKLFARHEAERWLSYAPADTTGAKSQTRAERGYKFIGLKKEVNV